MYHILQNLHDSYKDCYLNVLHVLFLLRFRGTTIDLGPDVPNPGLVDDVTPCMRNGALGIKGVCVNRVCRDISSLNIDNCPSDNNGTACYGNGVRKFDLCT